MLGNCPYCYILRALSQRGPILAVSKAYKWRVLLEEEEKMDEFAGNCFVKIRLE